MEVRLWGYKLDDYHVLSQMFDRNDEVSWWLFTLQDPVKNGVVKCGSNSAANEILWQMEQIDPYNFEWNGQKLTLDEC